MKKPRLALPLLLAATALAQAGPPAFVPKDEAVVTARAIDVPALQAALASSALGKLLADPDLADAVTALQTRWRERSARWSATVAAARKVGIAEGDTLALAAIAQLALDDVQSVEGAAYAPSVGDWQPNVCYLLRPRRGAEGRWTRSFEQLATTLRDELKLPIAADKIGSFAAHVFAPPPPTEEHDTTFFPATPQAVWLLHLPGQFAGGIGKPDVVGAIGTATASARAELGMELSLRRYLGMLGGLGLTGMQPFLEAFGLDEVGTLHWRATFAGPLLQQETLLDLDKEPHGLLGALVHGKAAPPPLPLPSGALLHVRAALDVPTLLTALHTVFDAGWLGLQLSKDVEEALRKAFTGGIAFGLAAPPPGSVVPIPRVWLAIGVADAAACERLLHLLGELPGVQKKALLFDGASAGALQLPDLPPAFQPSYVLRDSVLTIAESPTSLRAQQKAAANGAPAELAIGDIAAPTGDGEPVPSFEVRCDEVAVYKALHDVWLPWFELLPMEPTTRPLLRREDLPPVDAVARYLGGSRGVLRRRGNALVYRSQGALGGPLLCALCAAWPPILSGLWPGTTDEDTQRLALRVGARRLALLEPLFAAKDLPPTLAEFYVHGKLADDALLLPDDPAPTAVEFTARDGTAHRAQCSFHYEPKGLDLDVGPRRAAVVLIAREPRNFGRLCVDADGAVLECYGATSMLPLQQLLPKK